jgi:hypothetical protein
MKEDPGASGGRGSGEERVGGRRRKSAAAGGFVRGFVNGLITGTRNAWRPETELAPPAASLRPKLRPTASAEMQFGGGNAVEMEGRDSTGADAPEAGADAGSEKQHGEEEEEGSPGRSGKGRAALVARPSELTSWWPLQRSPASRARSNLAKFKASSPPESQSPRRQWPQEEERPRDSAKTGRVLQRASEPGSEGEASSALARASDVRVSEDLLMWAQRLPRRRSKKLDEASARSSLHPSVGKRLVKPVLCFILPPLRHWGPFL